MGKKNKQKKQPKSKQAKLNKKIDELADDIKKARKKIIKLLSKSAAMDVQDYSFKDRDGNEVTLSQMFGDKNDLVLIHNMGKSCSYCTLWADGFSGVAYFVEKKAAFCLVSHDLWAVQREFADARGWKFKMYSGAESTFIKDMGYQTETGAYWPGVSVFHKDENGKITRVAKDIFGPGDFYASPFHLFDLIPSYEGDLH